MKYVRHGWSSNQIYVSSLAFHTINHPVASAWSFTSFPLCPVCFLCTFHGKDQTLLQYQKIECQKLRVATAYCTVVFQMAYIVHKYVIVYHHLLIVLFVFIFSSLPDSRMCDAWILGIYTKETWSENAESSYEA